MKAISNPTDWRWIVGNETDDPLHNAFDEKRVVHPSVPGGPLPPETWLNRWETLMQRDGRTEKRTASVHIPFCQTRCSYCSFFQNFSESETIEEYVEKLVAEIRMVSEFSFVTAHPVHAAYIGGGTPSVLSPEQIERLLAAIRKSLPLANDCEVTFEARFHEFDGDKMSACITSGVTRFSLGVQSFDTKVRRRICRVHERQEILEKLDQLRSLDHAPVVADLMYGLPGQTMQVWEDDLRCLIESGIDGGSLYQLNVFEGGRLAQALCDGKLPAVASLAEQADMFRLTENIMSSHAYRRLSIPHWSHTTRERSLYNTLTKAGAVIIPFGAGAAGKVDGHTLVLDRNIRHYFERLRHGEKPIAMMFTLSANHALHADIVGQMDTGRLNLAAIRSRYDIDLAEMFKCVFDAWRRKGLARIQDEFLELTVAGRFWYANLTQAILDFLISR